MAATALTIMDAPGTKPTLQPSAGSLTLTQGAPASAADGVSFPLSGRILLLAHNTNAGAQTVTIDSVADRNGRTGDITAYSIAAGKVAMFGPFDREGWAQSDGTLFAVASHVDVKFTAIRVP